MKFSVKLKLRILLGFLFVLIGIALFLIAVIFKGDGNFQPEFISGYNAGFGGAFVAAGLYYILRNKKALTNPVFKKVLYLTESKVKRYPVASKTCLITCSVFMPLLFIATVITGFIDYTIFFTLAIALGVLLIILLIAYLISKRS